MWLPGGEGAVRAREIGHSSSSKVVDGTRWMACRATRRSALGRIGRIVLGAAGIGVVLVRPGLITPSIAHATHECGDPTWCGLCGRPCSSCPGGTVTSCATGSSPGSGYWSYCCCFIDGTCHVIGYGDCCGASCTHDQCLNNPDPSCAGGTFPLWCSGTYTCTYAFVISSC